MADRRTSTRLTSSPAADPGGDVMSAAEAYQPPHVMISDAHHSAEHKRQIRALDDRLLGDGVLCDIDEYHVDVWCNFAMCSRGAWGHEC